jgi:molybdopterin-containing oxidoreductase family iron-sulfur binding subunit
MLDACPHHHEEDDALAAAADSALQGINLRAPGESRPAGKKIWRSLDELANTKPFQDMLHREFPHAASEWKDGPSRRNFLKLMSASMALAGLSACTLRKTEEKIVPYVNAPEEVIPGRPLFFASTMPWMGFGKGVIVESHEGRPTKIEGNVDHPASLGSSDIWMQASVLELYDPDRSQSVMQGISPSSWGNFTNMFGVELEKAAAVKGKGLRILTGTVTSPTLARQLKLFLAKYPEARWHQHEAVGRSNARAGAIQAFGQDVESVYQFDQANVILSLDSNFLTELAGSVVYARNFIAGRKIRQGDAAAKMNRLYVAETSITVTGAQADHRLAIKSGDIQTLASDLLAALSGQSLGGANAKWITAVANDLKANAGKGLVVVGESQPPAVHAIAHAINNKLGNVGTTVNYIDPVDVHASPDDSLESLVDDINSGIVDTLVIIGTNPSYTAARSLGLAEGLDPTVTADERTAAYKLKNPLSKVRLIIHHGLYASGPRGEQMDETATFAHWHVPASHYLESWGDLRAFDGTASIVQPLIYPLYATKSEIEFLMFLNGNQGQHTAYDIVQETWSTGADGLPKLSSDDWQRTLERGVVFVPTKFGPRKLDLKPVAVAAPSTQPTEHSLEIVFRTDPTVFDGRYTNCGWLQELPKPISLLTWENVALMSVKTAASFHISQYDPGKGVQVPRIELTLDGKILNIPAMIMPGHADDSVTVYLGYGRSRCGHVGKDKGADAYAVKPANVWFASNVQLNPTDVTTKVATSQSHHLIDIPASKKGELDQNWIEGRELIQNFTLDEINDPRKIKDANTVFEEVPGPRTIKLTLAKEPLADDQKLLPAWNYDYNKWGMVIDNQSCIGCNACVIACQSENNIAIVGKDEVLNGREMHWLRIDTYFLGEPDGSVEVYNQPIPCMQCENAPCALVCPVEATTTSAEGINEQTYNRCVGTRYCSNNCPYKVRRFNFHEYTDYDTPQFMLQRNPNVTVRARGIMEKCNFCVQRVNNARIEAKKQDRPIAEGEVVPACAQSCPTQAITFGNLNDPNQAVTKLQKEPLRYTLLDELNAMPRVSYLGRVRNPNPELAV